MLKTRILTALCLIPFIFFGIFYLSLFWFALASGIIFLLTAWEWAKVIGFSTRAACFYLAGMLLSFILIVLVPSGLILILALLSWLVIIYYLFHFEKFKKLWSKKSIPSITGIWVIAVAWYAINIIHAQPQGGLYLTLLLLFIWGADSGAYFVGRAYGKNKLAPEISPSKSKEGVVGGVVVTTLIAAISAIFLCKGPGHGLGLVVLGVIISLISVVGDLFESMIKRQAGVKDSGQLLPGHGGLLDRLDSLLSSAPVFAFGLLVLMYL